MNNARLLSIASSITRNGVLNTVMILFQIFLLKIGIQKMLQSDGLRMIIRNGNSDLPVFRQVFMDGQYDISVPFKPNVIIDLGANIGLFSLLMNKRYPNAIIVAVEPLQSNYQSLEKNTKGIEQIRCVNKAIWNSETELSVSVEKGGEWGARVGGDESSAQTVASITMVELIRSHQISDIDVLKIDIEGAENELFQGQTEWMSHTKMIIIELHDFIEPTSSNAFIRKLADLPEFKIIPHGENLIVYNLNLIS